MVMPDAERRRRLHAQAGKAAIQQLKGSTSSFIGEAAEALSRIRAGIAACIDYPEEVSEEEAAADAIPQIQQLRDRLLQATDEHSASLLQNGLRTVLCGKPNVGKSSILNGLLGEDRAIVTSIPGTTRDTVDGTIMLNGMPVHLTDTAGIHQTGDEVEQIGIRKTENAMNDADVVLCVFDGSRPLEQEDERILRNADERIGRRCLIFVLTDMEGISKLNEELISAAVYRHDLFVIRIDDAWLCADNSFDIFSGRYADTQYFMTPALQETEKRVRQEILDSAAKLFLKYGVRHTSLAKEDELLERIDELFRFQR